MTGDAWQVFPPLASALVATIVYLITAVLSAPFYAIQRAALRRKT
jgi:biopolymer transport protein ExbB/TolQ